MSIPIAYTQTEYPCPYCKADLWIGENRYDAGGNELRAPRYHAVCRSCGLESLQHRDYMSAYNDLEEQLVQQLNEDFVRVLCPFCNNVAEWDKVDDMGYELYCDRCRATSEIQTTPELCVDKFTGGRVKPQRKDGATRKWKKRATGADRGSDSRFDLIILPETDKSP